MKARTHRRCTGKSGSYRQHQRLSGISRFEGFFYASTGQQTTRLTRANAWPLPGFTNSLASTRKVRRLT